MIFDTNVLIKLEREIRRRVKGPASAFVRGLPKTRRRLTPTIAGELSSGISLSDRPVWESFCAAYEMLPINADTAWIYGDLYRHLARRGQLIGANDLWIAATALTHKVPIATGNVAEFNRVPDLNVVAVG